MWNDSAIQAANPALATLLPAEPILIGYNDNTNDMTIIEVLKLSLESFSPAFKAALAAANRTLANLPPAQSGPGGQLYSQQDQLAQGNIHLVSCVFVAKLLCTYGAVFFADPFHLCPCRDRQIRTASRSPTTLTPCRPMSRGPTW